MSTQYIAVAVSLLSVFLPKLGIVIGTEELTDILSGLFLAGSSIWIVYQRTTLQKAPHGKGDVNVFGRRK